MGLLLLRIFAGVFVLTALVAMFSANALNKRQMGSENKTLLALWRLQPDDDERRAIHRRYRFCVKMALFSLGVVVSSIALAMMK